MNLLTGKAKQDFEKWMKNNQGYIYPDTPLIKVRDDVFLNIEFTPQSMQYALMVEFFDSVGMYINICHTNCLGDFGFCYDLYKGNRVVKFEEDFKTRNEATKAAILTAQDLFNNEKY